MKNSQKGAVNVWVVIVLVAAVLGAGYYFGVVKKDKATAEWKTYPYPGIQFNASAPQGLESAVFNAVDQAMQGRGDWDKKLTIQRISDSEKAASGFWVAKDYWDWIAWEDNNSLWHVLVSLDGFDCNQLRTLPAEYKDPLADIITAPSGAEYCYTHTK